MLKFRSMRVMGTEDTGWSTKDDPRKTKFGSLCASFLSTNWGADKKLDSENKETTECIRRNRKN